MFGLYSTCLEYISFGGWESQLPEWSTRYKCILRVLNDSRMSLDCRCQPLLTYELWRRGQIVSGLPPYSWAEIKVDKTYSMFP